jgi:hypothetical protein
MRVIFKPGGPNVAYVIVVSYKLSRELFVVLILNTASETPTAKVAFPTSIQFPGTSEIEYIVVAEACDVVAITEPCTQNPR